LELLWSRSHQQAQPTQTRTPDPAAGSDSVMMMMTTTISPALPSLLANQFFIVSSESVLARPGIYLVPVYKR
jgi:hypothetical protein